MAGSSQFIYTVTLDAGQAMKDAKVAAKALQQTFGNIKVQGNIKMAGNTWQVIQKQAKTSGRQAATDWNMAASTEFSRFNRSMRNIGFGGAQLQFDKLATNTRESVGLIKTQFRDLSHTYREFARETGKLGVSPDEWLGGSGLDRYMMSLQAAQRKVWGIRGMGAQLQGYGRGMMMTGAAGIGAAGGAAMQYAQYAEPLGRAARNMELSAQMADKLDASLRSMAGTVSLWSPEEQAAGLYTWAAATGEVAKTTDDLDRVMANMINVQKLASLGMVDQGTAVETVTDIMSMYQLGVSDTEQITATLIKVAATSKAEVMDLGEAFKYVGPYAGQFNTTFEETAAVLQLLSAYGQRGSRAGRGLGRLIENLVAPSEQAQGVLDDLFEKTFGRTDVLTTASGQFVGLAEAVNILATATENLTEKERAEAVARITTQNAARVLLPLLDATLEARKRNLDAIDENRKIIMDQADGHTTAYVQMMEDIYGYEISTKSAAATMEDQWNELYNSVDGRVKRTEAEFKSAMTTIGKASMEALLPMAEAMTGHLRTIGEFAEAHPGLVAAVISGAGLTVGAGALMTIIGKGITIYADIKALMMARNMMMAVDRFGVHVTRLLLGMQRSSVGGAGAAVSSGGALGPGWSSPTGGKFGRAAGIAGGAVIGATLGVMVADQISKALTGKMVADLFDVKPEARAAGEMATEKAATMSISELEAWRKELIDSQAELAAWSGQLSLLFSYDTTQSDMGQQWGTWAAMPEEYRTAIGPSGQLMKEQMAENEAMYLAIIAAIEAKEQATNQANEAEVRANAQTNFLLQQQYASYGRLIDQSSLYQATVDPLRGQQSTEGSLRAGTLGGLGTVGATMPDPSVFMAAAGEIVDMQQVDMLRRLGEELGIDIEKLGIFKMLVGDTAIVMEGFAGGPIASAVAMLREFGNAMPDEMTLASGLYSDATSARGNVMGMMDIGWTTAQMEGVYQEYLTGLARTYTEALDMTNWEAEMHIQIYNDTFAKRLEGEREYHTESKRMAEQAIKERQQMYEQAEQGLRSIISQQMQPTKVTAEDMAATEAGAYKDKWDEMARRMRAAMEGSAEWKNMIPEDVWAQGGDAAYSWGQKWIDEFYAGMHPESVQWDPLLDSIEKALAMAAGEKALIDEAMLRLKEERGIDATSDQVMAALGLTMPGFGALTGAGGMGMMGMMAPGLAGATPEAVSAVIPQMVEGVVMPLQEEFGKADMTPTATALLGSFGEAFKDEMKNTNWSSMFKTAVVTDVAENKGQLTDAGEKIGDALWDGIYRSFESANIVWVIAHKVLSIIAEERGGTSGGGEGQAGSGAQEN